MMHISYRRVSVKLQGDAGAEGADGHVCNYLSCETCSMARVSVSSSFFLTQNQSVIWVVG